MKNIVETLWKTMAEQVAGNNQICSKKCDNLCRKNRKYRKKNATTHVTDVRPKCQKTYQEKYQIYTNIKKITKIHHKENQKLWPYFDVFLSYLFIFNQAFFEILFEIIFPIFFVFFSHIYIFFHYFEWICQEYLFSNIKNISKLLTKK